MFLPGHEIDRIIDGVMELNCGLFWDLPMLYICDVARNDYMLGSLAMMDLHHPHFHPIESHSIFSPQVLVTEICNLTLVDCVVALANDPLLWTNKYNVLSALARMNHIYCLKIKNTVNTVATTICLVLLETALWSSTTS